MSDKALIMCVDDEPVNLTIMEELLQDRYRFKDAFGKFTIALRTGAPSELFLVFEAIVKS